MTTARPSAPVRPNAGRSSPPGWRSRRAPRPRCPRPAPAESRAAGAVGPDIDRSPPTGTGGCSGDAQQSSRRGELGPGRIGPVGQLHVLGDVAVAGRHAVEGARHHQQIGEPSVGEQRVVPSLRSSCGPPCAAASGGDPRRRRVRVAASQDRPRRRQTAQLPEQVRGRAARAGRLRCCRSERLVAQLQVAGLPQRPGPVGSSMRRPTRRRCRRRW